MADVQLGIELTPGEVDAIVASTTPAVNAAKIATKTIPIVMVSNVDPVELGIALLEVGVALALDDALTYNHDWLNGETPEQVATLQALECDAAQGFYFSKPLCAAEFEKMFSQPAFSIAA